MDNNLLIDFLEVELLGIKNNSENRVNSDIQISEEEAILFVKLLKKEKIDVANLKKYRLFAGITLRELEKITGISNSYLSQLENGKIKYPSYEVISKLKEVYAN